MPDREVSRQRPRDPFTYNNFDLLRFVFASTVLFVHAQVLSQSASLSFLVTWLSSDIAVKGFFVVSGLLVFMSYDRTRNLKAYAGKRFRRVYPAYFTVVMGAAVLLYPLSRASAAAYIAGALKYVVANLVFLNFRAPFLPGVFEDNAMREVNGSLWTLKIEVAFYIAVPVIAWLCARLGRLPVLVTLYLGSVLYVLTFESLARRTGSPLYEQLGRQLPGQLSYFLVGALWYFYFPFFKRYRLGLATAAAALAVLHRVLAPSAARAALAWHARHVRRLFSLRRQLRPPRRLLVRHLHPPRAHPADAGRVRRVRLVAGLRAGDRVRSRPDRVRHDVASGGEAVPLEALALRDGNRRSGQLLGGQRVWTRHGQVA